MKTRNLIDSEKLLEKLGFDYVKFVTPAVSPQLARETFSDILPALASSENIRSRKLAEKHLYIHQKEAFDSLARGENLVLKAGTGSGKTEAWFLYTAAHRVKTLAVYPTLALSNDQVERLNDYCMSLGLKAVAIDALRKEELVRRSGARVVRNMVKEADLVITNPAYLLNELKRIGAGKPAFLRDFLGEVGLVVLDEFDFYGPRSIAILLGMAQILHEYVNPRFQLVIMTATIADPTEAAQILTEINGRKTAIVDGQPYRSENRTYLVLGKSLKKIWTTVAAQRDKLAQAGAGRDILKALDDFEEFRRSFFKVVEAAKAAGVDFPDYFGDPSEIIKQFVDDEALTLVFTTGIASAEEFARKVKNEVGESHKIASHHHLLLRTQRREIEQAAREGVVKLIFTPRTLSQGIDIGLIRRVVHLGLPQTVREYWQREGRKGRRPDIPWTETIVIPFSQWDRDLLSRGVEVFRKWTELPLEKTLAHRENEYRRLFKTLFDHQSPHGRTKLGKEDVLFLRGLGLEKDGELTYAGKMAWVKMNFYEFAPPYGVKRWRTSEDGGLRNLEDISHVDLVEKFQPGAFDPSSDGVVVEMRTGGKMGRVVTAVVVDSLNESRLRRHDALAPVLEEYQRTKQRWGEEPNVVRDFHRGNIKSVIHLVAQLPSNGFGQFIEFPQRVEWRIYSGRRRLMTVGDRTYVTRDAKVIEVPTPTYGIYGDYTYGYAVEASPLDDTALLRLGASFILIVLRRIHHLSLMIMKFDMIVLAERKFVRFYEGECAGHLPKIDWKALRRDVEQYTPDELDEIILQQIDEEVYADFLARKLDWETARSYALKIIDYVLERERIALQLGSSVISLPKPSRALKLAAVAAVPLLLREDLRAGLFCIGFYDGEEEKVFTGVFELGSPTESTSPILSELSSLVDKGFALAVYSLEPLQTVLEQTGLSSLRALLKGLEHSGQLLHVRPLLEKKLSSALSLDAVEKSLRLRRSIEPGDLFARTMLEKRRRPSMRLIRSKPSRLTETIESYLKEELRSVYIAALLAKYFEADGDENSARR
uniref:DEAD/DEAH box helicase domain protein n=1 Tax=Caldiarchaeum subterraneum TaxID=311458 RepID=E6NA89_CALS0|nr:DEAD/DEAH box helicase domain protein [Candidatus Caldarchaeum subterraneum]